MKNYPSLKTGSRERDSNSDQSFPSILILLPRRGFSTEENYRSAPPGPLLHVYPYFSRVCGASEREQITSNR